MIPLSLSLSPSTILLGQLASHTFSPGTAAEGACQPVGFFSVWLTIWSAHLASLQGVCVCVHAGTRVPGPGCCVPSLCMNGGMHKSKRTEHRRQCPEVILAG